MLPWGRQMRTELRIPAEWTFLGDLQMFHHTATWESDIIHLVSPVLNVACRWSKYWTHFLWALDLILLGWSHDSDQHISHTVSYLEQWALKFCLTDAPVCSCSFICGACLTGVFWLIAYQFFFGFRGAKSPKQVKTHFCQPQLLQHVWQGWLLQVSNNLSCNQQSSQLLENRHGRYAEYIHLIHLLGSD